MVAAVVLEAPQTSLETVVTMPPSEMMSPREAPGCATQHVRCIRMSTVGGVEKVRPGTGVRGMVVARTRRLVVLGARMQVQAVVEAAWG